MKCHTPLYAATLVLYIMYVNCDGHVNSTDTTVQTSTLNFDVTPSLNETYNVSNTSIVDETSNRTFENVGVLSNDTTSESISPIPSETPIASFDDSLANETVNASFTYTSTDSSVYSYTSSSDTEITRLETGQITISGENVSTTVEQLETNVTSYDVSTLALNDSVSESNVTVTEVTNVSVEDNLLVTIDFESQMSTISLPANTSFDLDSMERKRVNESVPVEKLRMLFVSRHVVEKFLNYTRFEVNDAINKTELDRRGKVLSTVDNDDEPEMKVISPYHPPHTFTVIIDHDWNAFLGNVSHLATFVRKLSAFLGDDNTSNVHVHDLNRGTVRVKWSSVSVSDCRGSDNLFDRMVTANATIRNEFRLAFEPEFDVLEVTRTGACDDDQVKPSFDVKIAVTVSASIIVVIAIVAMGCKLRRKQCDRINITDPNVMAESVFLRSHGPFLFATEVEIVQFLDLNRRDGTACPVSYSQAYHNPSFVSDSS